MSILALAPAMRVPAPAVLRRAFVALLLGGSGAAVGCGAATPATTAQTAPEAATAQPDEGPKLGEAELRALVARVAAARRLPEKRPVRIELLEPGPFLTLLRKHTADETGSPEQERQSAALLLGFGLLRPGGSGPPPSTMQQVLEEQVAGFYDSEVDRVFVPRTAAHSKDDALRREGVLAHEIYHALQAQHFVLPPFEKLASEDQRLAQLALVEGDATVAMAAALGSIYGAPIRRTLRAVTDVTKTVPIEDLAREREQFPRLFQALPIARDKLLFPYFDGSRFAADLFRAGGFELVDRAYGSPPVSTEQVLHPEKYVAGELPVPVRAPSAPAGWQPVETGSMGELQIKTVLASCVDAATAEAAAAGWGGDSFVTAVGPDDGIALLWSTVWDTAADAEQFEQALGASPSCWDAVRMPFSEQQAYAIAPSHLVRRAGTKVAFARGLPTEQLEPTVRRLLELPAAPPTPRPLGSFTIAERRPLPEPQPGRLLGDVYRSDWLGIHGRVPAGVIARLDTDGMALALERPGTALMGGLVVSDRITNPEYLDLAFRQVGDAVARSLEQHTLQPLSRTSTRMPLGQAIEQLWAVSDSTFRVRMTLVPVCAGTGAYIFVLGYGDPMAEAVLAGWMSSFRWLRDANAPACELLDPK